MAIQLNTPYLSLDSGLASPALHKPFARALRSGEDEEALRLAAIETDAQLTWTQLGSACTRHIWLHQARPIFGQLMAIPILHDPAPQDDPVMLPGQAREELTCAINSYLQPACALLVFPRLRSYSCIAQMSPSALQQHLQCVHDRTLPAPVYTHGKGFADSALQLSFILAVVVRRRHWPEMPAPTLTAAQHMAKMVARALLSTRLCRAPQVLPLEPLDEAMTTGLCHWAQQIHERQGINRWQIAQLQTPADALRMDLHLGANPVRRTSLVVRQYQIALRGVQALTFTLNGCIEPRTPG